MFIIYVSQYVKWITAITGKIEINCKESKDGLRPVPDPSRLFLEKIYVRHFSLSKPLGTVR